MTINRNLSLFAQGTFTSGGVSIGNTTDPGAKNLSVTGTGKFGTTVSVGAATPSASGAGITFPATQSASTDVNTLDDYEEGTWTPSQGAGLTVVGAFSSSGTYTKVGRQVFLTGIVSGATSITAIGGAILCSAMPFNMGNVGTGSGANANANSGAVLVGVPGGSSLYSMSTITSSTSITFSVTYTV